MKLICISLVWYFTPSLKTKKNSPLCTPYNLSTKEKELGLGFLSLLSPELHQQKHQPINTNSKYHRNTRIPPSIALLIEIQSAQIISSRRVLANLATGTGIRVQQVRCGAHTALIGGKVFGAGLTKGRVEEGDFAGFAGDGFVPGCEDEQTGHDVVEWINVV